jgi:molecular chaperone DnaK
MTRQKIDYGIDLGTTNSAIARMEDGEPKIIATDLKSSFIMPSCVGINRKKVIQVGGQAANQLDSNRKQALKKWDLSSSNFYIEFKRTMGTDKSYFSSHMDRSFNSEELSAEVLKKLRSFITDEDFKSVVITVPAKFEIRQKDATLRAAKLAGFQHVELLQEPIAASMAYGLTSKKNDGYWIVFDFGGGTFDAALVKVEEGIMQVIDTDGDNFLGGKNLDLAIVDEIILPYLQENNSIEKILADPAKKQILQEAMKEYAEEAKIQLSFKEEHNILSDLGEIPGEDDEGDEFELDITVNRADLKKVIAPIFQKAIDITKEVLERNNLSGSKLDSLILVGGPTYSPILREMLDEQIKKPDTSADPMTVVATGAALYASTIDVSEEVKEASRDTTKIQLDIGYQPSTVETEEFVAVKILPEKTEGQLPDQVFAELERGDKAWSSGKVEIDEKGEVIEAQLNEGKPNTFAVVLYDGLGNRLEGQPDHFTIIQGSKVGSATLPCHIGIEIKRRKDGKLVFASVKGLEINKPLPAKGTMNGLKALQQIRPGNAQDVIKIPIYEGDYHSEGSRAIYNVFVYEAKITGEDLPSLLPENADVDLTLFADKSGRIDKIEAFFPYLDHTVQIQIPEVRGEEVSATFLETEIRKAKGALSQLRHAGHSDLTEIEPLEKEVETLENQLAQGRNDYDRKGEVLHNLRKVLRKVDELSDHVEWPKLEKELREEFDRLEKVNADLGNEKTTQQVNEFRTQLDEVIRKKDDKVGQVLLEEIHMFFFGLTFIYQLIAFVQHHDENFGNFHWKDPHRARQIINQAKQIIVTNPSKERLHPLVIDLINLLPDDEVDKSAGGILGGK